MTFLFKKKKEESDPRSYVEVFGDTVVLLRTFKVLSLALLLVILFQDFVILKAQKKPPIVISVSEAGRATVLEGLALKTEPDEIQIEAFVREFIGTYTSYDSKSIPYDFAKSLNLMHSEYQKRARRDEKLLLALKDQNIYTRVDVGEVRVEKNVPGWVTVWAAGTRKVHSYLTPELVKETMFHAYLTLAKVPRTVREPYGLLVYDYREPVVTETDSKNGGTFHER